MLVVTAGRLGDMFGRKRAFVIGMVVFAAGSVLSRSGAEFWINLPIVAIGLAIVLAAAPESTDPSAGRRVDFAGLVALAVGLGAVVLAMVQSRALPAEVTAALAVIGILALTAFVWIERRVREPIVEFTLFRNGPYFGASAAAYAVVGSYWAVMFFQPRYLQGARGHSAILSGLMILPVTAPMVFISPFSGRLIGRFGARRLMTAGMAFGTAGLIVLTQIGPDSSYGFLLAGAAFHALQASGDSFTDSIAGSTWLPSSSALSALP